MVVFLHSGSSVLCLCGRGCGVVCDVFCLFGVLYEAFPLKCWSPSDDGRHWPLHVKAIFYYYTRSSGKN
jgi:hypothetical protein